MECINLSCN